MDMSTNAPQREKTVPLALQTTQKLAEEVHKLATELHKSLHNVMREPDPTPCEQDCKKRKEPTCDLESQVLGIFDMLTDAKHLLEDIGPRLEA